MSSCYVSADAMLQLKCLSSNTVSCSSIELQKVAAGFATAVAHLALELYSSLDEVAPPLASYVLHAADLGIVHSAGAGTSVI